MFWLLPMGPLVLQISVSPISWSNPTLPFPTTPVQYVGSPQSLLTPRKINPYNAQRNPPTYTLSAVSCFRFVISRWLASDTNVTCVQVLYGKQPYWWLKSPILIISARFKHIEPINSSIEIQPNHLDFMQRCWSTESEVRPSVEEVIIYLQEALSNETSSV